jgi:hypothetical protein
VLRALRHGSALSLATPLFLGALSPPHAANTGARRLIDGRGPRRGESGRKWIENEEDGRLSATSIYHVFTAQEESKAWSVYLLSLICTLPTYKLPFPEVVFSQPKNTGAGDQVRTRLISAIDTLKVRALILYGQHSHSGSARQAVGGPISLDDLSIRIGADDLQEGTKLFEHFKSNERVMYDPKTRLWSWKVCCIVPFQASSVSLMALSSPSMTSSRLRTYFGFSKLSLGGVGCSSKS